MRAITAAGHLCYGWPHPDLLTRLLPQGLLKLDGNKAEEVKFAGGCLEGGGGGRCDSWLTVCLSISLAG